MLPAVVNCIVLNLLYQFNFTNGRQLYCIEPTVSVRCYQRSSTVLYWTYCIGQMLPVVVTSIVLNVLFRRNVAKRLFYLEKKLTF